MISDRPRRFGGAVTVLSTLRLAGLVVLFHRLVSCGAVRPEVTH
jgi:hypothetical protein